MSSKTAARVVTSTDFASSDLFSAHGFFLLETTLTPALFAADAKENWKQHCVRCHGADGKGVTKMGRKLKIRDLTQERTQKRLADDDIADLLASGYKDNSGEERMPAFRDKLSPEDRAALAVFVRSLKNGPSP